MSNPPAVPHALLLLLLPADGRETVSRDLLEEYREARIPASGRLRANLWYWRRVGDLWFRAYWWFVVAVVLLLAVHDIFNTFRAPSGASYLDGMVHFVRSLLDLCGKKGHAILLERVIPRQTSDPPDLGFEATECIAIGRKVGVGSGNEIPAFSACCISRTPIIGPRRIPRSGQ